jgi:cell shape-determining protein MreD
MSLALAAVGAALAALIQSTTIPFVSGGAAELNLVLVLAVIWTMAAGLEGGLVCALVGGLIVDVLLMRPLGLTALILTLAVGAAWLMRGVASRAIYPAIVIAVLLLAPAVSVVTAIALGVLSGVPAVDPFAGAFSAAIVNGLLAAAFGAAAIWIHRRARPAPERADW